MRARRAGDNIAENWPSIMNALYGTLPRGFDPDHRLILIGQSVAVAIVVILTWIVR